MLAFVFFDAVSFFDKVYIVEAVEFDAHFLHDFKAGIHFVFGTFQGGGSFVPGEFLRSAAELVASFGTEGVPPSHREAQPIFHFFAVDDFLGVVVTESHRVFTLFSFKFDFSYLRKGTLLLP